MVATNFLLTIKSLLYYKNYRKSVQIYISRNKPITSDNLFRVANIKENNKLDASAFEGLLYKMM